MGSKLKAAQLHGLLQPIAPVHFLVTSVLLLRSTDF